MASGETIIAILLGIIAWILYQIAKQLSYLTGKRIRFGWYNWRKHMPRKPQSSPQIREEKLSN